MLKFFRADASSVGLQNSGRMERKCIWDSSIFNCHFSTVYWNWSQTLTQERIQGGTIGAIAPPKTYISKFIHLDFLQLGKTAYCDVMLSCRAFICHSDVVKYISTLLQQRNRYETW